MVNFLTGKYKICNQCLQFKGKNPRIVKEINTKIMSKNNDFDLHHQAMNTQAL